MVTGCPQGERAAGCAAGLMGLSTGTRVPLQHRQAKQFYCLCPQPPSEVIFQLHFKGWDTIELSICLFLLNGIVTARPQETETQHNYHNQAAAKPLTAQDASLLSCGESYSVTSVHSWNVIGSKQGIPRTNLGRIPPSSENHTHTGQMPARQGLGFVFPNSFLLPFSS